MALTTSWLNVVHLRHSARHKGTQSTTEGATVTHRGARVARHSHPTMRRSRPSSMVTARGPHGGLRALLGCPFFHAVLAICQDHGLCAEP